MPSSELGNLMGEPCYIGVDLSKTRDLTCVSLSFPTWDESGRAILKVKQLYFIPTEGWASGKKKTHAVSGPIGTRFLWNFCDGKMIDQEQILRIYLRLYGSFRCQQVNYDPAMSSKLVEKLENLGLECIEVPQYPKVLLLRDDVERLFL